MLALPWLMILTGCQKETITSKPETTSENVTISVQLPDEIIISGTESSVNRCILEIYQDGSLVANGRITTGISNSKAEFQTKLISEETYQLVLWADYSQDGLSDTHYDTDSSEGLKNISRKAITYTGNNNRLDAFFAKAEFIPNASQVSTTIKLKRPFAQLNIYASDLNKLLTNDVKPSTVSVIFNNIYTSFNAAEGTVSNETSLSYSNEVAIIGKNDLISYDYLFASDVKSILNSFTMHFYNASGTELPSYTFTNIPVQRNYSTLITGNLLTEDTSLDVVIKPGFTEISTKDVYDGHSIVEPKLIDNTYHIESASNLAYIIQNMNQCSGKTLEILCNMDFANAEINSNVAFDDGIDINVNGNGKTIENLVLNGSNSIGGFIPEIKNGTIKDLIFDNLTVKVDDTVEDAYVGGIVGRACGNLIVTNCKVLNSHITGVNKIGGIVGFVTGEANNVKITNCRVENTTITGNTYKPETQAGDCGGIAGFIQSPRATITDNYVLNSTVSITAILTDNQKWGRGLSVYVGTCYIMDEFANIVISADSDATKGSKRIINGIKDGGLVRYQGLLGNIRDLYLPSTASLTINGIKIEAIDESTKTNPLE